MDIMQYLILTFGFVPTVIGVVVLFVVIIFIAIKAKNKRKKG